MKISQSRLILIFALLFIYASSQDCTIEHCTTCLNDTHCDTCDSGYIINPDSDQCLLECYPEDVVQLQSCLCNPTQVNQAGICYICEVDHCVLCGATKTTCDFCETGYELSSDQTQCIQECSSSLGECDCLPTQINVGGQCVQCEVSNCLLCTFDDSTSCDFCQDGYLLIEGSDSKNTCQKCQVSNCKTCIEGTISQCKQCFEGFELNANKQCQQKQTCTSPQYFDTLECICPYGLYVSGLNCEDCSDHCYKCSSDTVCIECQKGYYLGPNSKCLNCPANCLSCDNPTTCYECREKFEAVDGKCKAKKKGVAGQTTTSSTNSNGEVVTVGVVCSGSCLECVQPTICEKCVSNFYLSKGKCKKCKDEQCVTCDEKNPNTCTSCEIDKTLLNGKCVKCPQSCVQCSQQDYCQLCDLKYFVDTQGQCSTCKDNCFVCSSATDCFLCDPGYTVINNQCVECLAGCSFCDQTLNCLSCNEGFYQNSDSLCELCPDGCLSCTAQDTCTSCLEGYELDTDNMCYLVCEYPCYTCNKNKPTQCLSCFAGYILTESTKSCTADLSCVSTKDCDFCPEDFALIVTGEDRICSACLITDQYCMGCDQDLTTCNACNLGYYLNANNVCSACLTQCQSCTNSESCSSCKTGYYMAQIKKLPTGQCIACSKDHFCATCLESKDECHSCLDGFHLDGHKCISYYMITFKLLLEGNLDTDFMQKYKGFRLNFVNSIGGYYTNKEYLLTGKAIKQGSVNYEFILSIPENDTREDVKNTAQMVASQGQIYNGIKIISSQVQPNFVDEPLTPEDGDNTTTEEQATSLGLVLGLSIPLALIALIVLFLLMRKSPKHSQFESDNVISAGKLTNVSDI